MSVAVQHLIIYTFKRGKRKRCMWKPCRIVLVCRVSPCKLQGMHGPMEEQPLLLLVSDPPRFGQDCKSILIWSSHAIRRLTL